jgi:type VI secretion system secreted protein Hcp
VPACIVERFNSRKGFMMSLTGFLRIDDINGEAKTADHEGEIDVKGVTWRVARAKSVQVGRGRRKARAKVGSLICFKETDAASPYLALACMQGKSIPEATLALRKDSGETHLDYLEIKLTNVSVSSFGMGNDGTDADDGVVTERVALSFEKISVIYTVQADDHSAGDEHEIEYDVAAGV